MPDLPLRLARAVVSYLPSQSLLGLRSIGDLPNRLRGKPHEADFEVFGPFNSPTALFLDIGANRGQSINSMRLFAASASIVAFEPNASLAAHLEAKYADQAVTVHHCGVGDRECTLELHTPCYGHTWYDTRAAVTKEAAASFLSSENFVAFQPRRGHVERTDIGIRTLDSFDLRPTAVKIDVEGADFAVVEGGQATIARSLPLLMIEYPSNATTSALLDLGYKACALHNGALSSVTDDALNTIFITPEHAQRLQEHGYPCS